jgi:hypothetical protein
MLKNNSKSVFHKPNPIFLLVFDNLGKQIK